MWNNRLPEGHSDSGKGGEAGAQEEEADHTAHERDLVAGSLSGIYDGKKRLLV